jgi:nucleoid-associated protein YgaU
LKQEEAILCAGNRAIPDGILFNPAKRINLPNGSEPGSLPSFTLKIIAMGLMDFFKKGKEEPVKQRPSPPVTGPSRPTAPATRDYTIKSGDSLSKIAKEVYGDAGDWKKIFEANKDKIKDPNMIYPGQKIIIP